MTPETDSPPGTAAEVPEGEGLVSPPCSLFIGGHADGKRMTVERDMLTVRVPCTDGEIHDYRAERLCAPGKNWVIYVWDQITIQDAMDSLISNYPANVRGRSAQRDRSYEGA